MKRIGKLSSLFLLTGLLFALVDANAQNNVDAKGRKQGRWSKTYSDGKLKYEGEFKDDCEVGDFKYYNKDGSLKEKISYKGDCKTGYCEVYYCKGQVMSSGEYLNKKKNGVWSYYSVDGKLLSKETYKEGLKEGEETIWDTKGNVLEKINYKKGKKNGENYKYLYAEGFQTYTYVDDVKEGDYRNYYSDKQPRIEGQYSSGKKDGVWTYTDQAKRKMRVQVWKADVLISDKIILRLRDKERGVAAEEIVCLYPLGKQTCVVLSNGEKLTCFNSYDQILDCTDGNYLIRLNEKNNLYVNPNAVKSVKENIDGQAEVITEPKTDIKIIADKEGLKAVHSVLNKEKIGK